MKKTYLEPRMEVYNVELQSVIAASVKMNSESVSDESVLLSREMPSSYNVWGDDEGEEF